MFTPKQLEEISAKEKIEAFDRLYDQAMDHFNDIMNHTENDDAEHYIYEAVMELLGKQVWTAINAALRDSEN